MGLSADRAARNEDLFRSVNERIEEATAHHPEQWFEAVCECSDGGCAETIPITIAGYEHVRSAGRRFVMVDGHDRAEFERVVERHDAYVIAEKIGEGARVAQELDPRS